MSPDVIAEAVRRYVDNERTIAQTALDLDVPVRTARQLLIDHGVVIYAHGSKRRSRARPKSEQVRYLGVRRIAEGAEEYPIDEHPAAGAGRPATWGECKSLGLGTETPCPWVSCRRHLYLEVSPSGSIVYRHPDREVDELTETCSLAVAERGGATLEEVGALINTTRERVRQVEVMGLVKIEALLRRAGVKRCVDLLPDDRREAL